MEKRIHNSSLIIAVTVFALLISQAALCAEASKDVLKMALKDLLSAPTLLKYGGAEMRLEADACYYVLAGKDITSKLIVSAFIREKDRKPIPTLVDPKFMWLIQSKKIVGSADLRMGNYLGGLGGNNFGKAGYFRRQDLVNFDSGAPLDVVVAIGTRYEEGMKFLKLSKPVSIKTQLDY